MRYIVVNPFGKIIGIGTTDVPLEIIEAAAMNGRYLECALGDLGDIYADGIITPIGAPPSANHFFDYGERKWVLDKDRLLASVRGTRDELLAATDWRALRASEHGVKLQPEWLAYRQALRDITAQENLLDITWPSPPSTPSEK